MPTADHPADPRASGWTRHAPSRFCGLTGLVWSRREADGAAYGFVAGPEHGNNRGIVHGGMILTLADELLGHVVREAAAGRGGVTMQLNLHFLSAVRIGEFVEARGEVTRRANSVCFVRGLLNVGDRAVAAADGVWKLMRAAAPDPT